MIVSENKICSLPIFSHEAKNTSVCVVGGGDKVRGGVGEIVFCEQPWPSSADSLGMWPKGRLGDRKPCFKKKRSKAHPKHRLVIQTLWSPSMTELECLGDGEVWAQCLKRAKKEWEQPDTACDEDASWPGTGHGLFQAGKNALCHQRRVMTADSERQ